MSNSRKKAGQSELNPQDGIRLEKEPSDPSGDDGVKFKSIADPGLSEPKDIPDTARSIGGWMIVLLWLMALAVTTYVAQGWINDKNQRREGTVIGNNAAQQGLLLKANRFGQFRVRGNANGQNVLFLIDTGASGISIPEKVADTLGLRRGRAFNVSTANGTATVYATTLRSLSIGPFTYMDVKAHINPGMDGDIALLGMSYLRNFEIIHKGGEMIIRHP